MNLYVNYPSWIHQEVIPGFGLIRWYGLMYLIAFAIAIFLFRKQAKEGLLKETVSDDTIFSFFWWSILGLILGARIFSTLVYDTTGKYWQKPWLIFWPFDESMKWTGLQGMSYHGGVIGAFIGSLLWCIKFKKNYLLWADVLVATIPLGYTFGRLGNFINGELYGRVTSSAVGMIFPQAKGFSVSFPWVQEIMEKTGISPLEGSSLVNLPRHPSQLYEALFEGLILWALIWFFCRKKKPFDGFLVGTYLTGYGLFRFFIEYFREPDVQLGYIISAVKDTPTALFVSLGNISTGQILCSIMILAGVTLNIVLWIRKKSEEKNGNVKKK